ncbi:oligosaccharide repeat unit polymerase [Burkholderia ubonensis]|uniref:oligosaccharide repeat unit polymerase n=1 Tax=Burkholderia ubonensis TaxID=101571 RepID=UPI000A967739|nr:oligosaccharide repeat unit polymerase [Burkholderia ubonensis]
MTIRRTLKAARQRVSAYRGYWWEDPARLVLIFILPLYGLLSISLLGNQKAIERVYFDGFYSFAGALFLVTVMAVAALASGAPPAARDAAIALPRLVLDFVFALAFAGYLVMMNGVIAHPALLVEFIRGTASTFDLLELKGRIVGLSTLTQVTAAYVALYFYVFRQRERGFNRYKLYLVVLAVLTLLRSFIFAERLAVVEMALPLAFMIARFRLWPRRPALLVLGPFAAIPLLVGFFIASEYSRSWETYYVHVYDNILDFALERLGLYYSTALNNGAGIVSVLGWGGGHPMFTFDWLMRFPVIGSLFQPILDSGASIDAFLTRYADPEFNNPSGIFVHFFEWGWFGLLVAVLIGWILGKGYAGWRTGNGFWCCAHVVLYVSLLEIIRIPNMFSGRNFVPLMLLFVVFRCFGVRSTRADPLAGAASRYGSASAARMRAGVHSGTGRD